MKSKKKPAMELVPLVRLDLTPEYLRWLQDPEVTRYMETGRLPVTMEDLEHYYEHMTGSEHHAIFAIKISVRDDWPHHIGNITLNDIDWIAGVANIGIMIGDKESWGQGHGSEAIKQISEYAFEKLNLRKLWAGIYSNHAASIKAFEKADFVIEAHQKDHLFQNGCFWDKVLMARFKTDQIVKL